MPWKNGGGETTEIAVSPADASLDVFDWRVSMARVASNGPFSVFPGIDRNLTVLEGAGIVLEPQGNAAIRLTPGSPPYAFPGDLPLNARLIGGPILDLNVMARRGRARCTVSKSTTAASGDYAAAGDILLLLIRGAGALIGGNVPVSHLHDGDCSVLTSADGAMSLVPEGTLTLCRIDLWLGTDT
jgi:environmental stress-induced protein Ves